MQEVRVSWEMPVAFTTDLFAIDNLLLRDTVIRQEQTRCHRLLVFIDAGVVEADNTLLTRLSAYCEHHSKHLKLVCPPISLPAGEELKNNWQQIEFMLTVCHDLHIDRHSYVVGIGGGALLDSVGLVAAIAHRGIRHIRIPTTVLAQNDSGVGVKNGINLFGQKNYLGTFAPPFAVLNDYKFVESLTERDKICGMSEAVKVALIRDRIFFSWLEKNASRLQSFDANAMQHMIKRCAELHMHQICHGGDPFETGSARPLDFGHWSAHKLETLSDHSLRHGEAVAIGIALDTHYSVRTGLLEDGLDDRVCVLLEQLGFSLWHPALEAETNDGKLALLNGLDDFREHLGGKLTITLLRNLGEGIEVHNMDNAQIVHSIKWLHNRFLSKTRTSRNTSTTGIATDRVVRTQSNQIDNR